MLGYAMLMWIGFELGAPNWYWWCWGIGVSCKIIKLAFDMYQAGADK